MLRLERYIHTPETGLILLTVKYCQKTLHLRCLRGSWFVLNYFFLRLNNIIISTRINLFSKFSDGHDTMGHLNKFGASCTKKIDFNRLQLEQRPLDDVRKNTELAVLTQYREASFVYSLP